ncbi:hypothetical protein ACFE04_030436 [Oxalis oulophora]
MAIRVCVNISVTLALLFLVVYVTARTVPSDNAYGLNDQKNVVSYGGLGGYSGIGSNGLPFGGVGGASGNGGDIAGINGGIGGAAGIGSGAGGGIGGAAGLGGGIGGGGGSGVFPNSP